MQLKQPKVSTLNDDWAASFNAICSCARKTKALFYCNDKSCPDNNQVLFCTDCAILDDKHKHKKVQIRQELEKNVNDWKILQDKISQMSKIIKEKYYRHHYLIKYLDNENLLKDDFSVVAPAYNVSNDVENFEKMEELLNKTIEEVDILFSAKDLMQILDKVPQLV